MNLRKKPPAKFGTAKKDRRLRAKFRHILRRDFRATFDRMRDANGTIILNSDDLFMALPEYQQHPEQRMLLGPLLYPVAKEFTDEIYAKLLRRKAGANDTVIFTAGGSATGKSTILRRASQKPGVDFVVDTTFSNEERAISQVRAALDKERKIEIYYVYRDFRQSVRGMIRRALDPRSGRIVPIDDMARTHFGAQRAILSAMELFQFEGRVSIRLYQNVGDGKGQLATLSVSQFGYLLYRSVDDLQQIGQSVLDAVRRVQNQRRKNDDPDQNSGRKSLLFSEAFYEAARSQAQKGRKASRSRHA